MLNLMLLKLMRERSLTISDIDVFSFLKRFYSLSKIVSMKKYIVLYLIS